MARVLVSPEKWHRTSTSEKQPWECFKCIGKGRFLDQIRVFEVHSHLRFIRRELLRELFVKEECIPVGMRTGRSLAVSGRGGCLPRGCLRMGGGGV